MHNKRILAFTIAITAATLMAVGCSKTPEKLFPVKGVVSVGGNPLNGGTVQFEMKDKGEATGKVYTSAGEINEDGSYELMTFGKRGAPAGDHRVWVSPNLAQMPDKLGINFERNSPIPKEFMTPIDSTLSYTVAEESNTINVEVPETRRRKK